MLDVEQAPTTLSPTTTSPNLPAVLPNTRLPVDQELPHGITIIPGSGKMPAMRLPRRHPARIHHHLQKQAAILLSIVIVAVVTGLIAVTPLGADARVEATAAYQASANAFAEIQHSPAPFPAPAKGTPPPIVSSAPTQPSIPGGPSAPHVSGSHAFICTLLPWARYASRLTTDHAGHPWRVSVILAQWAIEQGWRIPGYTGYNLGNVSAIPGYPSVGGLPVVGSPGRFAFAYTIKQGVSEYLAFTNNARHYGGVNAAYPGGAVAQALALGRSPWDAAHYNSGSGPGSSLVRVMNSYNLYRFDSPSAGC